MKMARPVLEAGGGERFPSPSQPCRGIHSAGRLKAFQGWRPVFFVPYPLII